MSDLVIKTLKEPLPSNWAVIKNSKNQQFRIDMETQKIIDLKEDDEKQE